MGITELSALGIKPLTAPAWINTFLTPGGAGVTVFQDVRFALGAAENTGVALLRMEHSCDGIAADGESQIAGVVDDPSFVGTDLVDLESSSRLIFYSSITRRITTSGASLNTSRQFEPQNPYVALSDVRLAAHSIVGVDKSRIRLQYMYVTLTTSAYQSLLGRNLR